MFYVMYKNKSYVDYMFYYNGGFQLDFNDNIKIAISFNNYRLAYDFIHFIVGFSKYCWNDFCIVKE